MEMLTQEGTKVDQQPHEESGNHPSPVFPTSQEGFQVSPEPQQELGTSGETFSQR